MDQAHDGLSWDLQGLIPHPRPEDSDSRQSHGRVPGQRHDPTQETEGSQSDGMDLRQQT